MKNIIIIIYYYYYIKKVFNLFKMISNAKVSPVEEQTISTINAKVSPVKERTISTMYEIAIDCNPGTVRPDKILEQLIAEISDTELTVDDFIITSKMFGEWVFELYSDKDEIYKRNQDKISKILSDYHVSKKIRYARF